MALPRLLHREDPPTLLERIVERIPLEQIKDRVPIQMKPQPRSRLRRAAPLVGAGVTGAVLAYAFDPANGRERRARAKEALAVRMGRGRGNEIDITDNGRVDAMSIASDR